MLCSSNCSCSGDLLLSFCFFLLRSMSARKLSRTHDECRLIVCACCGIKNAKCVKITDGLEQIIKDKVYKEYTKENSSYPLGVCPSCRRCLFIAKNEDLQAVSQNVRDSWNLKLEEFCAPSRHAPCRCRVCKIARNCFEKVDGESANDLPRLVDAENEVGVEKMDADEGVKVFPASSLLVLCFIP